MATIRITNLRLRTIIGIYDWEKKTKQDVVLNITIYYDGAKPCRSDNINDTIDYKALTKKIIKKIESTKFKLIEKLGAVVLKIVLENPLVEEATVRVDKPGALRFADSVSVELTKRRDEE